MAYDNGKTRRKIDDNSSGMMTAVVVVKRFTLQSVVSKLAHNAFTSSTPSHHILRQSLPIAIYSPRSHRKIRCKVISEKKSEKSSTKQENSEIWVGTNAAASTNFIAVFDVKFFS